MYAHIRDLCLSGKTDERKVKSLSLCGHTLDEILSSLTALRHLTLYDCELDLPSSPSRTDGMLDSLTIIHRSKLGREFPSAGLINLLARFQHITKLTFDGCETRELLSQKALSGSKPLRNLKVARMEFARCSPSSQDHIAMALLRSFNIRNILCVQLSGLGPASHVTFDNLLRSSKRIESVGLVATTDLPILRRDIPLITGKVAIFFSLLRRYSFAALKSVDVVIHLHCRCLHDVHSFSCLYRNHYLMRRSLEGLDWAAMDTAVGLFASVVHFIFTINKTPVILKQEAYDALLGTVVDGVTFPLRLRHSISLVAREVIA